MTTRERLELGLSLVLVSGAVVLVRLASRIRGQT